MPVSVVATLVELVATVTPPRRSVWPFVSPRSLYEDLRTFAWQLHNTLCHPCVTSQEHHNVTSPGQEPNSLLDDLEEEDITEDITKAIATAQARDLWGQAAGWGTAGDNLMATAQQLPVALAKDDVASAVAAHEAQMAVATKATEEAVGAISQVRAATRRQQVEEALEPLECLEATCDRDIVLPQELQRQLRDIEAALEGIKETSADVPKDLVAVVAEAEWLWEANAHLATRHLLGTLGDICRLLMSRLYGPGVPNGSGCPVTLVARWPHSGQACQKATEDIPRLLGGQ
ncbi:hypothetical protein DUI87_12205 [Hirundo rustica rustica]|uniref:Uncharacterized protein n=1 Tax=Hirundo rustica rustica TaxID=333673 RepID=A0A3M0KCS4_HIRRU|nr:hypothetical protein DUI87_12205 [Hirundo rustica rustica]